MVGEVLSYGILLLEIITSVKTPNRFEKEIPKSKSTEIDLTCLNGVSTDPQPRPLTDLGVRRRNSESMCSLDPIRRDVVPSKFEGSPVPTFDASENLWIRDLGGVTGFRSGPSKCPHSLWGTEDNPLRRSGTTSSMCVVSGWWRRILWWDFRLPNVVAEERRGTK